MTVLLCFPTSLSHEWTPLHLILSRWYPEEEAFKKKLKHRALDDIRESLAEMKFYQETYFRSKEEVAQRRASGQDREAGL